MTKVDRLPLKKSATLWKSTRRKHRALREELLQQIAIGTYRPGDLLPSENQLAEAMKISRSTVRLTLAELEREGQIRRVHGKGSFVAEPTSDKSPTSRTASFALIVPDVTTGYYPALVSRFDRAANAAGRPIVVCNSFNDVNIQANHFMRLMDQGIAGILLNPSSITATPCYQVRLAQSFGIPVVMLHRGIPEVMAPVLELPANDIGRGAARLMIESGHRRVAYFAAHRYATSEAFEKGFRAELAESGIELAPEMVDYGHARTFTEQDFHEYEVHLEQVLRRMLLAPNRPTAIFASFDPISEMVYLIAGKIGLRVPEDLSIITFGGADRQTAVMRRLTAVTMDESVVANNGVQLLIEMLSGKRPLQNEEHFKMPLSFSKGQTLAACK